MSIAKSTAFCAVSEPSVPTPIVVIIGLPLAVGVAGECALLRDLRVLAVPDRDRAADRRGDDHAEDHPAGPTLGHVHDGVPEYGRSDEEDEPLYCDSRVHACPRCRLRPRDESNPRESIGAMAPTASRRCCEKPPFVLDALELLRPAVDEPDPRAGDEISDRAR